MSPHFRIERNIRLEELNASLIEGVHLQSGAHFMHIANDDPENLFCLSFQTLPETSNGVAHILEHTVLCGSKKFPIKDPFFAMTRRSLNTFMNALTGPDFTCYPAASQVEKDFYNLLDVYIDAVFHPLLNRLNFLQEGVRLELDPHSGLRYKGIVFNEMKGALASGAARASERMNRELYPDNTYGHNPGGDPKEIPNLTYEELKAFHEKYYHPSHCLFFFYGNLPLEKHLNFIHEKILKDTAYRPDFPPIPPQPRFLKPKRVEAPYPLSLDEALTKKTLINFGWITCSMLDTVETLALTTLILLMMDHDASVLKRAIMNTKLCKQALAYIDTEMTEVPIILSLQGCERESADELERVIFETFSKIAKEGFAQERIESVLHQMEFSRSEITGDTHPYGLSLFMRSALMKQHGVDPTQALLIHTVFDQLREKIAHEPNYLSRLVEKHFSKNTHYVRLIMIPSHELESHEIEEEKMRLRDVESRLTEEDKKRILKDTKDLLAYQHIQEDQDNNILPTLTLEDIPKIGKRFSLTQQNSVYSHACYTNQIIYATLAFNLPPLSEEELPYLRLLAHLIPQLGAGSRDYLKTLQDEQEKTGGLSCALAFNPQAHDAHIFKPALYLKGKALYRHKKSFFSLLKDMAVHVDLDDRSRVEELVHKQHLALSNSIQRSGLGYALNLTAAPLSPANQVSYLWFGLGYYEFLKKVKEDIPALISRLKQLYAKVIPATCPHLVLTADQSFINEGIQEGFWGLKDLKGQEVNAPFRTPLTPFTLQAQGRPIASQIAFNAVAFKTVPYTHPDAPLLSLAAHLFDNLVLHRKIREQGGAYGSGANSNPMGAEFNFYSSRDPHIASTFDAFKTAIDEISSGHFEEVDLVEAKLEMMQALDSPVAPGSQAELAYEWLQEGKTNEVRQKFRERLLASTKEDVIRATGEHIANNYPTGKPVVFAGRALLERENKLLPTPLKIISL